MNCLLDNIEYSGNDLSGYMKAAETMDSHTYIDNFTLDDVEILTFDERIPQYLQMRLVNGSFELTPAGSVVFGQKIKINTSSLKKEEMKIVAELCEKKESIIAMSNETAKRQKFYFIGDTFYKTLAACQTGLGGKFLKTPGFVRDMALCQELHNSDLKCHVLIRNEGRLLKVFAMYRKKEERFPFVRLGKIMEEQKNCKMTKWLITQQKAEVRFELTDFTSCEEIISLQEKCGIKLRPQILLRTSDTGYYATSALAIWKHEENKSDQYFVQKAWELTENTNSEELLSQIRNSQVAFYEKFCERCMNEKGESDLVKTFGLTKAIGLKSTQKIREAIECMDRQSGIIYLLKNADELLSPYQKSQYEIVLQNFVA